MKSKNSIQIVETPIIDKYDFHENNGIINPAFLESESEGDKNNSNLVVSDYRQCFRVREPPPLQYPSDDLTINYKPNGSEVTTSWVYDFNNASSSTQSRHNPMDNNTMNGMYRSVYGMGYNEHMSYEMDLNKDHRQNIDKKKGCSSSKCWSICIKILVWTIIVVCLLGVLSSVAFIIYIEKFTEDSQNTSNTTALYLNTTSEETGITSMPSLVNKTSYTLPKSILTTKQLFETTTSFTKMTTNTLIASSEYSTTSYTTISGKNQSQNPDDNIPSTTEPTRVSINTQKSETTSINTKSLQTTNHSSNTSSTALNEREAYTSTLPTVPSISTTSAQNSSELINKTTEMTKSIESRSLASNISSTLKSVISSVETTTSNRTNDNKSNTLLLNTTSTNSILKTNNTNNTSNYDLKSDETFKEETISQGLKDIIEEMAEEIEEDKSLNPLKYVTTPLDKNTSTPSPKGSNYSESTTSVSAINQRAITTSGVINIKSTDRSQTAKTK